MNKVLVTGADGFIGSHLTEALLAEGCEVRALAQYNSFNNWDGLKIYIIPGLRWSRATCGIPIIAAIL